MERLICVAQPIARIHCLTEILAQARVDWPHRYRDGVRTRFFAPANLRAASESPAYMALVQHYITERYTLRYSGGLVPPTWCMPWSRAHGIYVSPRVIGQPRQAAQAV
ncbi:sedoheptulose-1,7-bisphosphatase [Cordyceps militaris CM01]|uniref:Sedoheptulose-1,7-bisphosphatase n=1 Tax=Cordyceps militaris (strain CM01) TaxID=983644 RepID=G3JCW3_CORMM|nr:sedoheptulose-1,7-bisphosphatase [Cordyceps militaris CM01]EGX92491.1 sedoheptulose-1,7-bisphosphatase [Cordyceps militaris CM01]